MQHITVLLNEAIEALALTSDSVIVDATLGSGGHTKAIAEQLGSDGLVIACDVDPEAVKQAQLWSDNYQPVISLHNENFAHIHTVIADSTKRPVNGILADLGWRSEQFFAGERGFSFQVDEPLLMTFGDPDTYALTAADVINQWDEGDIANVLFGYGEERYSRRIARAIVEARQTAPITTSLELAEVIAHAVPSAYAKRRIHPATKSFQALRIAVNDELTVLDEFITSAFSELAPDGRLVIITFHSLEDRIVKHRFRELQEQEIGTVLTKKPVVSSATECAKNARARSAKLRTIKKH